MASRRRAGDSLKTDKKKKRKNKTRCEEAAELCSLVEDEQVKKSAQEAWSQRTCHRHGDLELDCHPFPHCIIKNFLASESFVESLQRELMDLNFHEKSNDLYKFKQSDDLKKRTEPHISGLRAALFGRFRSWLGEVLQVELEPIVDISCAKYEYTDVLLCHDDELEGRRVAFILYLVPPWQSSDGGTLDLYTTDSNFQPQSIVKSLVPSLNTLILFEVSPVSFHQVSEVLTQDKCRLSLSGWFHGPPLGRPPRHREPAVLRSPHLPRDVSEQMGAERKVCMCVSSLSRRSFWLLMCVLTFGFSLELSTPVHCGELRRWSHGGYTLLHDAEAARAEYALDLVLPFCGADWQSEFGGFTCYVANEEDEELLTVYPEDNSLALVYRDKETLKFVKHVNHKSLSDSANANSSTRGAFYDFSFVYYE
uniref:Prolyl 3-hydroxylase OGFOD1 n=1 Tax=Gasterosteus aculeatus aculeatus TaxID=481459 RepID=A0AAQ4QW95_GASAC